MRIWIALAALMGAATAGSAGGLNNLEIQAPDARGWPRLSIVTATNRVVRLDTSADLLHWREVGRSHDGLEAFPDPSAALGTARFYRAVHFPRTAADDWKNQVRFPDDALLSPLPEFGELASRWIKFAIDLSQPDRVYFQDSARYPFHYNFAQARLSRFQGLTRPQFDAVSLHRAGQQVVLGSVLFAPSEQLPEVGIQFVGGDPYTPAEVSDWFDLVRACLVRSPGVEAYYFPTYEQERVAEQNRAYFSQRGIQLGSVARWVVADECYAAGWALGRLVTVPASELNAYYRDGRLRPGDILVLDRVPAEVPPVAGIVTLLPATPNSHVALLAQSFGIPFVYFAGAADRDRLRAMEGQEVWLRAVQGFGGSELRLVNLEGQLSPEQRQDLLAFHTPPPIQLIPKTPAGRISMETAVLRPADTRFVGGKAAHFGLLRRSIPDSSPSPAIAFTFDLWDAYLDQVLPGGKSLRTTIAEKLSGQAWPPDMAALTTALTQVRDLITGTADFSDVQKAEILVTLQEAGFGTDQNIRFRSSTNVEDGESFSGAGLYDSFSGCLADELDGDTQGPSVCDPTESNERGVFRALRKVFASFFNDNAYLERLRHGVDESIVGMAVLVHYSTPDEFELANGVATVSVSKGTQPGDRNLNATLVTQAGAMSVSNPEATARPEVVDVYGWSSTPPYLAFRRASSLVPLGGRVLAWEQEYRDLIALLDAAARAYEAEFPSRRQVLLDFEYKKIAPEGRLRVKQIRPVPLPAEASVVPWLLNETNHLVLSQGEYGDVFGAYRLKSWWRLSTVNTRLIDPNLGATVFSYVEGQFLDGFALTHLSGNPAELPEFKHARTGDELVDSWTVGAGAGRRTFELRTWLPRSVPSRQGPAVFLSDGQVQFGVVYATPQPTLGFEGPDTTLRDAAMLVPVQPVNASSLPQSRTLVSSGVTIQTRFFWPAPPTGPVAGYTAPLQAWIETRIEGLTTQPIVLRGDLSQTYHPGHHNFYEEFLFDPHLEPGLDSSILAELAARNIRALYATTSFGQPGEFMILGLDNSLRSF